MKRILVIVLALIMSITSSLKADEGMWVLPLIAKLNMGTMNEMGLQLSAEDIYSINQSSLKDAIVIFGGGCTGELISDKGLVLTNHHCGYGVIQALSSVENNYLKDGFWAKSFDEELPAEGISATFLKRMEDVTDRVLKGVTDKLDIQKRKALIESNMDSIVARAKYGNDYLIHVQSFLEGNQYFLVVYEKYTDVRLVGAPPSSIGKFGFDTDNWMWPRHTGDFSMFRIYGDKDGKPAAFSEDNVPLKPKHHLPISLKGNEKGDFAMTLGFPGSTNRYLSSWGIEERMTVVNRARIKPRGVKQDIWKKAMLASEKVNIQYASKFSRSSNYWKNSIGMNRGLEKLKVLDQKRKLEKRFVDWVNLEEDRKSYYGDPLSDLQEAYKERASFYLAQLYLVECMLRGTEIFNLGLEARSLERALISKKEEAISEAVTALKEDMVAFYKDYSSSLDQKVMSELLQLYAVDISKEYHPDFFSFIIKKFKGDFAKYAQYVFAKSVFVDEAKLNAFLENPSLKKLQKDPVYSASLSVLNLYYFLSGKTALSDDYIGVSNRLFVKGLMEMDKDKVFYPDANFTMRLSYGKVGDYEARDAVIYKHFTTLGGVIEKEIPDNYEFMVPAKLKELYESKDYGRYADKDGLMHVNFTTDNDITGGNSGSPVINSQGELFGLAFDGNWEAMSGDIAFETELQKCINVDIRYVLFIIDKFAEATNLIDELTIVE